MALDLFAGIPVSDYEAAKPWYERLLGGEPSFIAHATEAVWELAMPTATRSATEGRTTQKDPDRGHDSGRLARDSHPLTDRLLAELSRSA